MIPKLQRILFILAAGLIMVDLAWGFAGGFAVEVSAYTRIALLSLALVAAGIFYSTCRKEPRLAAMLFGASFLCAFSAAASLLNYFLLTFHGPRIDAALASADVWLGFDWVAMMTAMAGYQALSTILFYAYNSVLPQIALMVVLLGWLGNAEKIYRFCIAVAAGALTCIAIWAVTPSFGAMSVYPPDGFSHMTLALDSRYAAELVRLLAEGPGLITPHDTKGLIGFPSYHAVLALLAMWYARYLGRLLFWPLAVINAAVMVATPIHGGHHLVDVLAAFPATALALWLAGEFPHFARKPFAMVNSFGKFTITPVPKGLFRIAPAHSDDASSPAIKPKLSGLS